MKKIMAMLTMLMLVMPFAGVNAISGNYYVYGQGDEVNFYSYEGDEVGVTTTILSDEGADSQYVKTLVTGVTVSSSIPYAEDKDIDDGALTDFTKTPVYGVLKGHIEQYKNGFADHAKDISVAGNLSLITLDELKTVFGATLEGDKYTIDATKWGKVFDVVQGSKSGMYTQTVEGNDVWVIKWTKDQENHVNSIVVEKQPVTSAETWELVPVVYFDKTYDCTDREAGKNYACYSCNDDYTWTEVGKQADTCKLVDTINAKADCVKGPKTGIEDYILPFIAIAGVCAIALAAVNRKDLFRGI